MTFSPYFGNPPIFSWWSFSPVLGYLDDAIILPLGTLIAIRLIPQPVLADSKEKARIWIEERRGKPKNRISVILIIFLWCILLLLISYAIWKRLT